MTTPAEVLALEAADEGTAEDPPGSNRTPYGEVYGLNGEPWCDIFQSVKLTEAGIPTHFASCAAHIAALRSGEAGTWLGNGPPSPGDLAFYSSSTYPNGGAHINMVETSDGATMTCWGGNEHDMVRHSSRSVSSAYGFGRPNYARTTTPEQPPAEQPAELTGQAPPFPLPAGWYFGPESGPKESVSGYHGHGDDLAVWQQQMADRGWDLGPDGADGRYGPATQRAAAAFQAEKDLEQDGGKIGPETWAAAWTSPLT